MTMMVLGYLVCWHDQADLGDGSFEQFQPNAFMNGGAKLVFAHDPRAGAALGHARVTQDRFGAKFVAELDEHDPYSRRVLVTIRNGLDGMSFRFKPLASRRDGDLVTIERALLLETSVVDSPCYALGGCWLVADEPYLPPRLAALARQFATAAPLPAKPPPSAAAGRAAPAHPGMNPLRLAVARYMASYVARASLAGRHHAAGL